ncbi:Alpha/Beta hydrolase protein [Lactarius akahatsu]|uniref:Alpha/Beta hydrolase protein n=1 Tax=Lactarius akahatsu TaxID=416441 RepID=A0AAD4L9I3_9AGAM|nr:Alpha/Beta hydrolase protein [Lactarius akahatsu]
MSSLTTRTTLGLMPLAIGILLRHYYKRVIKDKSKSGEGAAVPVPLRLEELKYDEAFTITRNFMDASANHTVEELQQFTNLHTPVGPSSQVVRAAVPQTCCAEAARVLVRAFGGEDEARRVVGGVRWWQVRPGDRGIDAEWIMDKRDWKEVRRREKAAAAAANKTQMRESGSPGADASSSPTPLSPSSGAHARVSTDDAEVTAYHPEMDEMRCLLWAHGGGYYFGSVNQERYMIQRYARKIHGRVFAPNYRLAPQYPFPCGLQDLLASYLFLIEPPPGAAHRPVQPDHIVVGGDSAGGGLALAFLQVVRDAGLPPPAGAVLVSPWCDMHHSFPSIFLNVDTDIVPATGLTTHKPSPLWPPPPDDVNFQVRKLLRSSAQNRPGGTPGAAVVPPGDDDGNRVVETQDTRPDDRETVVRVPGEDGAPVEIRQQIQLYTTNDLLIHPLVSPALAYLGGLPPLFVIASDREVLRDEILFTAHRAANPEKYPVSDAVKKLYPAYEGIENRMKPTMVHLQVYDDAAHVIPLMFIASTPAVYCYRAIATFIKHVTNMPPTAALQKRKPPLLQKLDLTPGEIVTSPVALSSPVAEAEEPTVVQPSATTRPKRFSRMTTSFRRSSLFPRAERGTSGAEDADALAGDPVVYHGGWAKEHDSSYTMIRERVATNGTIRPLEPEPDLPGLHVDPAHLGIVSSRWVRVYLACAQSHEKKYAGSMRQVARRRERAISLLRSQGPRETEKGADVGGEGWSVAWALDDPDERPPPSSLVARCDTAEALALARAAPTAKRKQNAASFRGTKRRTSDEVETATPSVRKRPGGEFWKRLSRGQPEGAAPAAAAAATVMQPPVIVAGMNGCSPGGIVFVDVFCLALCPPVY